MQIKTTKCYSMSTIIILYHKRYQVLVSISRDAVEHLHNAVTSLRNRLAVDLTSNKVSSCFSALWLIKCKYS